MCLENKFSEKEKKEWLKNKPDTITCYKSVSVHRPLQNLARLYPPHFCHDPIKRINKLEKPLKGEPSKKQYTTFKTSRRETSYAAYFHLYAYDPKKTTGKVIKCKVSKKDVTTIGYQWDKMVIVTRQYEVVGEDKYFLG